MRAPTLRRTGFAATLLTGVVLCGAGLSGLARVDATLEQAASPPARPVLVSHRVAPAPGGCDGPREHAREPRARI